MGQLLFRCPKTGKDFDSGFEAGSSELTLLPESATLRLRCKVCGEQHELKFIDAKLKGDGVRGRR